MTDISLVSRVRTRRKNSYDIDDNDSNGNLTASTAVITVMPMMTTMMLTTIVMMMTMMTMIIIWTKVIILSKYLAP